MTPNRPRTSHLRTLALSLATAALGACALSTAAQAEDEYIWVRQDQPPVDAVTAMGSEDILCRITYYSPGYDGHGSTYLGVFRDSKCLMQVNQAQHRQLQFLVPTPGHVTNWVPLSSMRLTAPPPGALVGSQNRGEDREICSFGGSVGEMQWGPLEAGPDHPYATRCNAWHAHDPLLIDQIYILTGTIVSIYE